MSGVRMHEHRFLFLSCYTTAPSVSIAFPYGACPMSHYQSHLNVKGIPPPCFGPFGFLTGLGHIDCYYVVIGFLFRLNPESMPRVWLLYRNQVFWLPQLLIIFFVFFQPDWTGPSTWFSMVAAILVSPSRFCRSFSLPQEWNASNEFREVHQTFYM